MSGLPKPIPTNPRRGEIWNVSFDPAIGSELKKTRPAVVVSPDSIGILNLRIVVPITGWQDKFEHIPWMTRIPQLLAKETGLTKESAADAFQVKSIDASRFVLRLGRMAPHLMRDISAAVALCVDFSH